MSNAKVIIASPCCGSCDLRFVVTGEECGICPDFYNLSKVCKNYEPLNPVEVDCSEHIAVIKPVLIDARTYIQNIYDNTDSCTCPAEGDCVCGQAELLNIIKKIDEVI